MGGIASSEEKDAAQKGGSRNQESMLGPQNRKPDHEKIFDSLFENARRESGARTNTCHLVLIIAASLLIEAFVNSMG